MKDVRQNIPTCVGIILDGNRRWAKARDLPSLEGHRQGFLHIEPVVFAARDLGIKHLVVYAFSTENWNRSEAEVSYLLQLFEEGIRDKMHRLLEEGVRIRFVGQKERFSEALQQAMSRVEAAAPSPAVITLWVCLSYGGRADIVQAAQRLAEKHEPLTAESIAANLWTAEMPAPDIIIRPGGEQRLSNFLLWESAYSELFFIDTYWPDFSAPELGEIVRAYGARERRMGK